jgi:hypothetical protein
MILLVKNHIWYRTPAKLMKTLLTGYKRLAFAFKDYRMYSTVHTLHIITLHPSHKRHMAYALITMAGTVLMRVILYRANRWLDDGQVDDA